MEGNIDTQEVLNSFLARSYWLEIKMEQTKEWFAYLDVKSEDAKQVLFQITKDSDNHKHVLKKLFLNINDFNLENMLSELSLDVENYSFRNKINEEIFQEIFECEKKAYDLFTLIKEKTDKNLIKKVWKGKDPDEFFNTFSWLISEEKRHIELIQPYSLGSITRIL
jgi:rubrerythrin